LRISGERIWSELSRILAGNNAQALVTCIYDTSVAGMRPAATASVGALPCSRERVVVVAENIGLPAKNDARLSKLGTVHEVSACLRLTNQSAALQFCCSMEWLCFVACIQARTLHAGDAQPRDIADVTL
jgi:tRNA nucleotidyltransferase/poly(A) polymerase